MEKYGFVYLWYDRKHKRYYVGSHWGSEDDGYICSSNWMRDAYRRRREDFKRRILSRVNTTRQELLDEEHKWLNLIKIEELGKRYYNLRTWHQGHWTTIENTLSIREKISKANKGRKLLPRSDEYKKKISKANKGRKQTPEAIEINRQAQLKSYENGRVAFMKGKTYEELGYIHPMLGRKHTEESKQKIKEARAKQPPPRLGKKKNYALF
jgi:hypothetical protein